MEYVSDWAGNIITFSCIFLILEAFIPHGNMKKYLRFIAGLLIIVIILKPIFSFRDIEVELPQIKTEEYRQKTEEYIQKSLEDEKWKIQRGE